MGVLKSVTGRIRRVGYGSVLETVWQDVRYACRSFSRSPGFTAVVVLTLALGIGANTAIFSVIRAVLLKPAPYPDANRLVQLSERQPITRDWGAISGPNYLDWAQQNTVFERMAGLTGGNATLSGGRGDPVFVQGRRVSASYFDVLGLRAALGRTFAPDEDQPGKAHVVLLSHRLWASQFGSDPAVIGRAARLDGELYAVIGVMPAGTIVDLYKPRTVEAARCGTAGWSAYARWAPNARQSRSGPGRGEIAPRCHPRTSTHSDGCDQ